MKKWIKRVLLLSVGALLGFVAGVCLNANTCDKCFLLHDDDDEEDEEDFSDEDS